MNPKDLKECSNDEFFVIDRHFFEIDNIIIYDDYEKPSELHLKNFKRKIKIPFGFIEFDFIYDRLCYPFISQSPFFNFQNLIGKNLIIDFTHNDSGLTVDNINFYNNPLKDALPKAYKELVIFSINHLDWFLQGLSKHNGLNIDLLEYIKNGRNIDYNPIFLLNKSLSKEQLRQNKNRITTNEEFLAQNQSPTLWDKQIIELVFDIYEDPLKSYGIDHDKKLNLKRLLSENKELIKNDILLIRKKNYFDWDIISASGNINWDAKKILLLQDRLDWQLLSANPNLPWSKDLIESFSERWHWKSLSTNIGINWNTSLVNEFDQSREWNFYKINHANITESLIDNNIEEWDWDMLSQKWDLPWSENFIKKYRTRWEWTLLCLNKSIRWNLICVNENIKDIDWYALSENRGSFWEKETIILYYDYLNLQSLTRNPSLPWSKEMFDLIQDKGKRDKQYRLLKGEEYFSETIDSTNEHKDDCEYYVDPDTDIVFLRDDFSWEPTMEEYQAEQDREAYTMFGDADSCQEDHIPENPLLNEEVWNKVYGDFLSEDFIYEVLIFGVRVGSIEVELEE